MKTVEIIGVPSDFGANIRGTRLGPTALRIAGLLAKISEMGINVIDKGDLFVPLHETIPPKLQEHNYVVPIAEICTTLMAMTKASIAQERLPLILGGDHSIAIGSISGTAAYLKEREKKLGLIWVDAHADFNIPSSSPTGNIHGMPLATVVGRGHELLVGLGPQRTRILEKNIALLGIRSVDAEEKELLRASKINYFTMEDIDQKGIALVVERALSCALDGTDGLHLSFDVDSVDPLYAPGVSSPAAGGLNFREARLLLERIHKTNKVVSMDFVEMNPLTDMSSKTAHICVELILAALGKTII